MVARASRFFAVEVHALHRQHMELTRREDREPTQQLRGVQAFADVRCNRARVSKSFAHLAYGGACDEFGEAKQCACGKQGRSRSISSLKMSRACSTLPPVPCGLLGPATPCDPSVNQ
eukprot:scaffold96069_cov72-Phaeocystis_antarctica.AAC.8